MYRTSLVEHAAFATERAREYVSSAGGLLSRARSLVAGDALFFATAPQLDRLRTALASGSTFEQCDAMKRIVAQMCKGNDMHALFADVVKNIHTPSIELRKLIYLYMVRYAEQCPHEALLAVSALQRDLCDVRLHVRALALRVLCGMRIATIQPVVLLAVRTAATDVAPLVRKAAALALLQVQSATTTTTMTQSSSSSLSSLREDASVVAVLRALLCDRDADVVGAAALALDALYPDDGGDDDDDVDNNVGRVDGHTAVSCALSSSLSSAAAVRATRYALLDGAFRSLCRTLCRCEECGQVVLLRVLLRYARRRFANPYSTTTARVTTTAAAATAAAGEKGAAQHNNDTNKATSDDSDSDATSSSSSSLTYNADYNKTRTATAAARVQQRHDGSDADESEERQGGRVGADHALLLRSALPLLHSLSSAVVVGVTALYYHCAPRRYLAYCVKPLLRVLGNCSSGGSSSSSENDGRCAVVLHVMHAVMLTRRELFVPYVKHLCLLPRDGADVRERKLQLLAHLLDRDTMVTMYGELRSYLCSYDANVVVQTLRALGVLVLRQRACAAAVVRLLTPLLLTCTRATTTTTTKENSEAAKTNNNNDNNTTPSPPYDGDVMAAAVAVLRILVAQGHDVAHTAPLVFRLMQHSMRGELTTPSALSTVLWLVGEHIRVHASLAAAAPECFRAFAGRFVAVDVAVKAAVLSLGCKVAMQLGGSSGSSGGGNDAAQRFRRVYAHVLTLARYDAHYAIRDYARLLECTANTPPSLSSAAAAEVHDGGEATDAQQQQQQQQQLAAGLRDAMLSDKPVPRVHTLHSSAAVHRRHEVGTLSHALQHTVLLARPLPRWATHASPDTCRDAATRTAATATAAASEEAAAATDDDDDDDDDVTLSQHNNNNNNSDSSSSSSSSSSDYSYSDDDSDTATSDDADTEANTAAEVAPHNKDNNSRGSDNDDDDEQQQQQHDDDDDDKHVTASTNEAAKNMT